MSVSLLLGLVYLISDSGLQKNLIGLQRMPATAGKLRNGQAFKPGTQESRKGITEIEGKATRVGASECGQRASFNRGKGATVKSCQTAVTTPHETAVDLMHHKRLMMD